MANILAVDDEEDMLETIAYNLERAGHHVTRARNAAIALQALEKETPDLIVSDIMMPGMDGITFCKTVRARAKTALTPFLFVTAKGHPGDKYVGLRAGADDYVTKPFDLTDLLARVNGRLEHRNHMVDLENRMTQTEAMWHDAADPETLRRVRDAQSHIQVEARKAGFVEYQIPYPSNLALQRKVEQFELRFPPLANLRKRALVGNAPNFLKIFEEVLIAAGTPDPVLILGETGTGKTAIAEAIWSLGNRAQKVFRTINCSELATGDPTIATGKLFGHGKGSGLVGVAREGQPGILDEAHGGVLFMDEVGDLPRQAQTLLLLPLEGRPFRPAVGIGADRIVDIKFVAATNREIARDVTQGGFPRDLYERFAGHVIRLPPLRDRIDDVPVLARWFLSQFEAQQEIDAGAGLSDSAVAALSSYDWPGNVRELRRVIRQAAQRARLDGRARIERRDLPDDIAEGVPRERRSGTQQAVPLAPARFPEPPPRTADADPVTRFVPTPTAALTDPARPRMASTLPTPQESPLSAWDLELRRGGFSDRELAEIAALRACGFRVGEAETRLGYSSKSRTFSHRLRGLSFKALSICQWDVDRAGQLFGGSDDNLAALASRRLRGLLDSVALRLDDPDEKVFANLLNEHRQYLQQAVVLLRQRRG
jgi:two-component system, NtrC family, response regulator HydG